MQEKKRVVLVTGASSGIGKACAERLHRRGYQVYGTSRGAPPPDQVQSDDETLIMVQMDVDDDDSVQRGVGWILNRDKIDVLVNCAGFTTAGAIEETEIQEAKAQFETNFFGVLRVCQAVLPAMRQQGSGYIINISSLASLIALPFQGMYSATKSALDRKSTRLNSSHYS